MSATALKASKSLMNNLYYGVVLTGCIGSGKSTVSKNLQDMEYSVICADSIAHTVLQSCAAEVAQIFGEGVLENGVVNRKALGEIVFNDKRAKKQLESLLHPKITREILSKARELEVKRKLYFLDIPLFFELGGKQKYPARFCLVVYAPKQTCLERIVARDCLDLQSATLRIDSQMDIEWKKTQADFVIANTQGLKELQNQTNEVIEMIVTHY